MKTLATILALALAFVSTAAQQEPQSKPAPAPEAPKATPGAAARAALGRMAFLVGDWEGEGWSLSRDGGRRRFWVKEFYMYRGERDLMDMEGRFGDIRSDGTRAPQNEFGLGFLYFNEAAGEYRMWHYSDSGEFFDVTMNVDPSKREMWYSKQFPDGVTGRFRLVVGTDGVWVSTFEILQADKTWLQVMEFRMKKVAG